MPSLFDLMLQQLQYMALESDVCDLAQNSIST